jgi:5'-methylthioadenosine phosphorylase
MGGLSNVREVEIDTPFGRPSDAILLGEMEGMSVAFLPRHGRGHYLSPTEVPVRANIYALKTLGVECIISISAVGSLREDMRPRDMAVLDQLIDRTRQRVNTFFGDGIVVHVGFADPFCPQMRRLLLKAAQQTDVTVHDGGTCVVMEGPAFSTRAESHLYRSWGADVIGMTALPEAKLAREAEMCYAVLACVTDYDCWHEASEDVTIEMVVEVIRQNAAASQQVVKTVVSELPRESICSCASALGNAIITSRDRIPQETKERLAPILGKYLD